MNAYKKKADALTKADFKKLIRQIALATYSSKHGVYFASLLSAMRGPDDDQYDLKIKTTCPIRSRLGWHTGMMNDAGQSIEQIKDHVSRKDGEFGGRILRCIVSGQAHFSSHISTGLDALEYFGFDKPRKPKQSHKY